MPQLYAGTILCVRIQLQGQTACNALSVDFQLQKLHPTA